MTEKEFLDACCGQNEDGEAKSGISCSIIMFAGGDANPEDENAYREISSRYTKEGTLEIVRVDEFIQVSLIFKSSFSPELRTIWNQIETYGATMEDNTRNGNVQIPLLSFNVIPEEYSEEGYLGFSCPIFWVLQPEYVGDEKSNVIRMLFRSKDFFIHSTPSEINERDEEALANRTYRTIRVER